MFILQRYVYNLQSNKTQLYVFNFQINVLDDDGEKIHQSNSFKRIMYSVLGQTDY